ncbi:hypothetical protein N7535_002173 [Penicillium sp. DV-2018c]|nr:hypothetical protein N7461_004583 [Penicillium sp. DV-2018c]KAJ5583553.1 hypothetical protein N7535_002173 [Penicillium sp. DV-2018c]
MNHDPQRQGRGPSGREFGSKSYWITGFLGNADLKPGSWELQHLATALHTPGYYWEVGESASWLQLVGPRIESETRVGHIYQTQTSVILSYHLASHIAGSQLLEASANGGALQARGSAVQGCECGQCGGGTARCERSNTSHS